MNPWSFLIRKSIPYVMLNSIAPLHLLHVNMLCIYVCIYIHTYIVVYVNLRSTAYHYLDQNDNEWCWHFIVKPMAWFFIIGACGITNH